MYLMSLLSCSKNKEKMARVVSDSHVIIRGAFKKF